MTRMCLTLADSQISDGFHAVAPSRKSVLRSLPANVGPLLSLAQNVDVYIQVSAESMLWQSTPPCRYVGEWPDGQVKMVAEACTYISLRLKYKRWNNFTSLVSCGHARVDCGDMIHQHTRVAPTRLPAPCRTRTRERKHIFCYDMLRKKYSLLPNFSQIRLKESFVGDHVIAVKWPSNWELVTDHRKVVKNYYT